MSNIVDTAEKTNEQAGKAFEGFTKNVDGFWAEVKHVWNHGLLGTDIDNILIAIAIFFGFLVFRGLFSKYVLYKLHQWSGKTKAGLDDKIVDTLIPPIKFIPIILGLFFAGKYLELNDFANGMFTNFIRTLIAFNIFWAFHRGLDPVSHSFKRMEKLLSKSMVQWMFKALKVLIIFIGAAIILEIWGIEVGPLLAGLGLFGVAVALGAQDLFKNLIAGLTVIAEKRFYPGEWILVEGVVEGTVEDIGFRSTKIRRFDKAPVHVPNAQLSDTVVTNFSRMPYRRIYWQIGVTYDTTTPQLKTIRDGILNHIKKNGETFALADDIPTLVHVDSFGASSIDLTVYCFTKSIVWKDYMQVKEDLAFEIKRIVEEAGSAFALPSTSVYVETLPKGSDKPEQFVPPADPNNLSSRKLVD